ncbi:hypothetical protein [Cytophaga aurantiaca]|uniref:hypothetical protein n=1 Tax=Cytophaga aurantiaca TaxID=29530 RepID=UPI000381284F|nr:hypothetical protein [Cytophaga aurantiaca]
MIRFKDIHIPKPCSVDYDSLPGDEVKRFCSSCEKYVYDFRGKDEVYFNSIINAHGKVCGFFYEDDIKSTAVKIKRPFYSAFAAKLFGIFLFIKTLLSSDHAQASTFQTHTTTQQATDSSGVKVNIKNRPSQYQAYLLDIFINNTLYKSGANLDDGTGFIWLPDSLKENDKIRIVIKDYGDNRGSYKIHRKEYHFNYKESEKITVKIKFHKRSEIHLFKKRRRSTGGVYY